MANWLPPGELPPSEDSHFVENSFSLPQRENTTENHHQSSDSSPYSSLSPGFPSNNNQQTFQQVNNPLEAQHGHHYSNSLPQYTTQYHSPEAQHAVQQDHYHLDPRASQLQEPQNLQGQDVATYDPQDLSLENYFRASGGWYPPVPCAYCREMNLHCFMIKTTEANPNPVSSCSVCVGLFRQCSLAERAKRHHSAFETPRPVVGHLHGVSEEDEFDMGVGFATSSAVMGAEGVDLQQQHQLLASLDTSISAQQGQTWGMKKNDDDEDSDLAPASVNSDSARSLRHSGKRAAARMVKKTRPLRTWFGNNQAYPYPTNDEKNSLAIESDLTPTQVSNWFTNARRRQRQTTHARESANNSQGFFPQGSPMPQSYFPQDYPVASTSSISGFTPLSRWENSPPEQEAVSATALKEALDGMGTQTLANGQSSFRPSSQSRGGLGSSSGSVSEGSSFNGSLFNFAGGSSNSGSSAWSHVSGDAVNLFSPASGEANRALSTTQSAPTGISLYCTFCHRPFKKKSDWVRHEQTIHIPELASWVCSLGKDTGLSSIVWPVERGSPTCVYCGFDNPDNEHIRTHEFESCAERPIQERSFVRKDHLWQHLQKFHSCKRWEGSTLDLNKLQNSTDAMSSRCGFCGIKLSSWKGRAAHLTAHFKGGLTMAQWNGDSGIEGITPAGTTQT